ncbi:MAG: cyclic nucleotide-binding domain-containing protein [Actinomycetota bacterium]
MTDLSKYFRNPRDPVDLEPGAVLFQQGDAGDSMYAVLEGELDVIIDGTVVDHIAPGRIFGEMALVEHSPRSATMRASSACRLARVDQRQFLFMVHETPTFALDVMKELIERLHHLHQAAQAIDPPEA